MNFLCSSCLNDMMFEDIGIKGITRLAEQWSANSQNNY